MLQKVMDWMALSEQHARTLLIYYRWDVERVFEMLERKGREALFLEAGVRFVESKGEGLGSSSGVGVTCEICFDDVDCGGATVMDCGHCFCNDCKFSP